MKMLQFMYEKKGEHNSVCGKIGGKLVARAFVELNELCKRSTVIQSE